MGPRCAITRSLILEVLIVDTGGESLEGDIVVVWDNQNYSLTHGVAVESARVNGSAVGAYSVMLSTAALNCGHKADGSLPRGTTVIFHPQNLAPGSATLNASIINSTGPSSFSIRYPNGTVDIQQLNAERVSGHIDVNASDASASGDFEVSRCF